jgi:hypothetical protein
MELNGALSNPFSNDTRLLEAVNKLRACILGGQATRERVSHPLRRRGVPLLETAVLVLQLAERPMSIADIHTAMRELLQQELRRTSIKAALSEATLCKEPRVQRVRRGVYSLASASEG